PMPVIIEGKTYYEGIDVTHEEFYQMMSEQKQISSSQPSPYEVTSVWDKAFGDGYETVVYIPMSSGISGSWQTAAALAQGYDGRVYVANNHRISVTQRFSVLEAKAMAEKGCDAEEIKEALEKSAYESLIYVGVETLEYLKRSGRVTPAGAAIGTVLNIKPLLIIEGERLDAFAKVRGTKKCKERLLIQMKESADRLRAGGSRMYIGAAGSFVEPKEHAEWLAMVQETFAGEEICYNPLTISIGCHVGAGAFGMGISRRMY
ncbi:MAG: DegV family protein, partial [Lachnospiraceae bacterium]|nr:DegV family protein [Lachnospiraceae bacterium]